MKRYKATFNTDIGSGMGHLSAALPTTRRGSPTDDSKPVFSDVVVEGRRSLTFLASAEGEVAEIFGASVDAIQSFHWIRDDATYMLEEISL